jgi:protein translocase SecG subunit
MATFTLTLFMVICILLIVVVLLQKGRGGGLGGALGGGMTSSAFGTRTGDVFTWVTIVLTGLFLLLAILNTVLYRPAETQVYRAVFIPAPTAAGIEKDTLVTVKVSPRETKDVKVFYTLDGTEPSEKSSLYKKDLLVKPGQTLKAAVWRNGKLGAVTAAHYARPGEAPEVSPTGPPDTDTPATEPAGTPATPSPFSLDPNRPVVDPNLIRDIIRDANTFRPTIEVARPSPSPAPASSPAP